MKMSKILGVLTALVLGFGGSTLAVAQASPQRFGPWTVSDMNGGNFAASFNDSGGILGKYCYQAAASCMWLMVVSTGCEDGSEYMVLIITDQGAAPMKIYCTPVNGNNRYVFTDFDAINNAVTGATELGIAFPLQSGKFQVSRFNVRSAASAMAALELRMRASTPARSRGGTRDQTL